MKKSILLITTLFASILFSGCGNKHSQLKIENLSTDEISQITILTLEACEMIEVTNMEQIQYILDVMHQLSLFVKSDHKPTYNTELIQYTLHTAANESLTIDLLDTCIGYNNNWYLCDPSVYNMLNDIAYCYLP